MLNIENLKCPNCCGRVEFDSREKSFVCINCYWEQPEYSFMALKEKQTKIKGRGAGWEKK